MTNLLSAYLTGPSSFQPVHFFYTLLYHFLPSRSLCFLLITVNGGNSPQEYPAIATCSTASFRRVLCNTLNPRETRELNNDHIILSIIHLKLHNIQVQKAELRALTVEKHFLPHCVPAGEKKQPCSIPSMFLPFSPMILEPLQHGKHELQCKRFITSPLLSFQFLASSV